MSADHKTVTQAQPESLNGQPVRKLSRQCHSIMAHTHTQLKQNYTDKSAEESVAALATTIGSIHSKAIMT